MSENIGMMSGAYFASKSELLKWLNDFFQIGYTKVEQVASGAIHCQILDSIFPGKVPLHNVNFAAKHEYEFVKNYKVLQNVFDKQNIKRHIEVEKLIRAKYQDNLEFLQWIKHLWDVRYGGQDYDAVARREEALARFNKGRKHPIKKSAISAPIDTKPARLAGTGANSRKVTASAAASASKPARGSSGSSRGRGSSGIGRGGPAGRSGSGRRPQSGARPAKAAAAPAVAEVDTSAFEEKIDELEKKLAMAKVTIEGLEKERNFYFGKLRQIEILCQTNEEEDAETKAKVLEYLYATDDNDEFEAPEDEVEAAAEVEIDADELNDYPEEEDEDLTF